MSMDVVNSVMSLISTAALVISVVFVGMQLRAGTKAQRAMTAWQAENLWSSFNTQLAFDPKAADLLDLIFSSELGENSKEEGPYRQAHYLVRAMLQISQAQYFLFREGSLPKEYWDQERHWLDIFMKFPLVELFMANEITNGLLTPMFRNEISTPRVPSPEQV